MLGFSFSLIICVIGALVYLFGDKIYAGIAELGKWAFIVGLAAYLFVK